MPNEITPSQKRSREESDRGSQSAKRSGSPEKLQQLRGEHMRFTPEEGRPTDHQATSKVQGETAPYEDGSSAPPTAQDQPPARLEAANPERMGSNLAKFAKFFTGLKKMEKTEQDNKQINQVVLQLKPVSDALKDGKPMHEVQYIYDKENTYKSILASINSIALKSQNDSIKQACMEFLREAKSEDGHLDPEAIRHLTQRFIAIANRPPLPDGQCYPPLDISLTDDQYSKVWACLRELRRNTDIDSTICHKARKMAYIVSDSGKAVQIRYLASDSGKAAQARYNASDKGKAAQARYRASDSGKVARARYAASDKGKAVRARYRASDRGKAVRAQYDASGIGKAAQARSSKKYKAKQRAASQDQEKNCLKD